MSIVIAYYTGSQPGHVYQSFTVLAVVRMVGGSMGGRSSGSLREIVTDALLTDGSSLSCR